MAHFHAALVEPGLDLRLEFEQAQQVGHGGTGFSDGLGDLLVGQSKLLEQAMQGAGFLERIQVVTLDVLDECHGHGCLVIDIADNGWNLVQAGELCCPPAALAGDDFVGIADWTHDDRLHHALRRDRVSELLQLLLVEMSARLVAPALDQLDAKRRDNSPVTGGLCACLLLLARRFPGASAEKRVQATPESPIFCRHDVCSRCLFSISSARTA